MKDHSAPKVAQTLGVKLDELNGVAAHKGVVAESLNGGIPRAPGAMDGGIPWQMPPAKKKVKIEVCEVLTKAGTACRAKPIKGQAICIGHSRVKTDGPSIDSE